MERTVRAQDPALTNIGDQWIAIDIDRHFRSHAELILSCYALPWLKDPSTILESYHLTFRTSVYMKKYSYNRTVKYLSLPFLVQQLLWRVAV